MSEPRIKPRRVSSFDMEYIGCYRIRIAMRAPPPLAGSARGHLGHRHDGRSEQAPAVAGDHLLVPTEGILGHAPLRLVVDVDEAKALLVAVGPFEVVEQRPGVIALDRHTVADRARQLEQPAVHMVDA